MMMILRRIMTARSLIIDTDAGFDDFLAIQCLQQHQPLITTVGGVLPASRAAKTLRQLFPSVKDIAMGQNAPSENALPEWLDRYRSTTLDSFLRARNNPGSDSPTSSSALTEVMNLLTTSSENSVDILCMGPLTNLALWLKRFRETDELSKIRHIWIMGGNHPGKQKQQPEFNFGWDPVAVQQVLGVDTDKIHLLTSCVSRVEPSAADDFRTRIQSDAKYDFLRTLLEFDSTALSYDPVCAFASQHPSVEWDAVTIHAQENGLLNSSNDGAPIRLVRPMDVHSYLDWIYAHAGGE